jgi:hypothetical protein
VVVGVTTEQRWWPSPFGADDQLGMLNHVDEAKRLAALGLVREGRVYDLGRVLDETCPVFPGRYDEGACGRTRATSHRQGFRCWNDLD